MKLLVGLNFGCNGVKKKKGDYIDKDEAAKIGAEFSESLIKSGHVVADQKVIKEIEDAERKMVQSNAEKLGVKFSKDCNVEKLKAEVEKRLVLSQAKDLGIKVSEHAKVADVKNKVAKKLSK